MAVSPTEALLRDLIFQEDRPKGIHVTDLVYDCLRKQHYHYRYGYFETLDTAITLAVGRALHGKFHLGLKEMGVEWNGVIGSVDGYDEKTKTLVDLKTCQQLPKQVFDHHQRQVEYYALLLEKMGHIVHGAYLVYLAIGSEGRGVRQFRIPLRPLKVIETEFLSKLDIVKDGRNLDKLPKRTVGWLCRYCVFANRCFGEE